MSRATPMTTDRRSRLGEQRGTWTARQYRQLQRMSWREHYRSIGQLPLSDATGERVRRPITHRGGLPERGSFRTHVAVYCAPCDRHTMPRLHRHPRGWPP